jgi:hypothetical protein
MGKASEVSRAHPLVQGMITKYIEKDVPITTSLLQQAFYRENYDTDSKIQRETIYGCIVKGRNNVIKLWDAYLQGHSFYLDLVYVQNYEGKECENQLKTQDFEEFYNELQRGKFGKDTTIILKNLGEYPGVAILFKGRMDEYSKAGNNFLTASYGKESIWKIPSFWKWNIREFNLYRRTLKILRTQLERGRKTKVLLPSGIPIPRVLEYETIVRAALEDGTAWECSKCGARNLSQNQKCVICGTSRT